MAQPATLYLSRQLVRSVPFTSQRTFRVVGLPAGGQLAVAFDIGAKTTDRNQLLGTVAPVLVAPTAFLPVLTQFAIGTLLDALVLSTAVGNLTVQYAVDSTCTYATIASSGVVAGTPSNISGLRITGRYCGLIYTNTSGAPSTVELGGYVRSA